MLLPRPRLLARISAPAARAVRDEEALGQVHGRGGTSGSIKGHSPSVTTSVAGEVPRTREVPPASEDMPH